MKGRFLFVGFWLGLSGLWASAIQPSIPHLLDDCERPSRPGGPPLPLHCAAARGDLAEAQRHLDAGLPVNAVDRQYRTPLHWAVQYGRDGMIAFLIERGADPNAADRDGNPPLFYTRRPDIIGCLLERGAAVDAQNHLGHTLLHQSVHYPAAVERLLAADAAMDAPNAAGLTPLDIAGMAGRGSILARMIAAGAEIPVEVLHQAAHGGQVEALAAFLDGGVDVDTRDEQDNTLLHKALMARNASRDMVALLLAHGADVQARNREQITPLHLAVRAWEPYPYLETSRMLIQAGAAVGVVDAAGMTPFAYAVAAGSHMQLYTVWRERAGIRELVRLLMEQGADAHTICRAGRTTLHHAAGRPANFAMVRLLLEHGLDANARDPDGKTPLHYAALEDQRQKDTIRADIPLNAYELIDQGADIDAADSRGRTPLHAAAEAGRVRVGALLLEHGADPGRQDPDGNTPLDLARRRNHAATVALLEAR